MKRLNAAISESFLKSKRTIGIDKETQESNKKLVNTPAISTKTESTSLDLKSYPEKTRETVVITESNNDQIDSKNNQVSSNAQPIILTSTSISISLEENTTPPSTSTKKSLLNASSSTSSSVLSTPSLKSKPKKGNLICKT